MNHTHEGSIIYFLNKYYTNLININEYHNVHIFFWYPIPSAWMLEAVALTHCAMPVQDKIAEQVSEDKVHRRQCVKVGNGESHWRSVTTPYFVHTLAGRHGLWRLLRYYMSQ